MSNADLLQGTKLFDPPIARWVDRPRLDVLKLVAVASMVIDHANTVCFDGRYPALRAVGRLAFPLFAFVLACNFVRHTRHPVRFVGRLLAWGAVSQLFFLYAFENNLLNIFFTLALGLCYAALFRGRGVAEFGIMVALALLGVSKFMTPLAARLDFGIEGVLLVFTFAQLIESPTWWRAALAVLFTALVNPWTDRHTDFIYGAAAVTSLAVIAASANVSANPAGEWEWMRRCRLCFYFFYPAHLFVLKTLSGD